MDGARFTTLVAVTMLFVAACGGTSAEGGLATGVVSVGAAGVVGNFDPSEPDSFSNLDALLDEGPAVVADVAPFLESEDEPIRFAALYVVAWVAQEEDAKYLIPLFDDPSPGLRAMASGSAAGLGERDALAVLVDLLDSNAAMPYSEFGRPVSQFAMDALVGLTGERFDSPSGWASWWEQSSDSLQWSGTTWGSP